MKKRVECQVCHTMVQFTIKCLCEKWLCPKCTGQDPKHSADYDKHHADIFWKSHKQ